MEFAGRVLQHVPGGEQVRDRGRDAAGIAGQASGTGEHQDDAATIRPLVEERLQVRTSPVGSLPRAGINDVAIDAEGGEAATRSTLRFCSNSSPGPSTGMKSLTYPTTAGPSPIHSEADRPPPQT